MPSTKNTKNKKAKVSGPIVDFRKDRKCPRKHLETKKKSNEWRSAAALVEEAREYSEHGLGSKTELKRMHRFTLEPGAPITDLPLEIKFLIFEHLENRVDGTCLGLTCLKFYQAYRTKFDGTNGYGSYIVKLDEWNREGEGNSLFHFGPGRPLRRHQLGEMISQFFSKDVVFFVGGGEIKPAFVSMRRLKVIGQELRFRGSGWLASSDFPLYEVETRMWTRWIRSLYRYEEDRWVDDCREQLEPARRQLNLLASRNSLL